MGGLRLSNLVAVLLLVGACEDPYDAAPPPAAGSNESSGAAPSVPGGDDETTLGGSSSGEGGDESTSGGEDLPSDPSGSTTTSGGPDDEEGGSTWPAASMDSGAEPDTTGGDAAPTCTKSSCPVEDLQGCTGDCDPCDPTWTISWVPVPGVHVYAVRTRQAKPANGDDYIYTEINGGFRVTADGEPSTYQWAEVDGRISIACDFVSGGCPAVFSLLDVEVVGCIGDPQYPAGSADCAGPGGGTFVPHIELPTGTCDPEAAADTTSTG